MKKIICFPIFVLVFPSEVMFGKMYCFQVQCSKKTAALDKFAVCLLYVEKETFIPGYHVCHAGCAWLCYCRFASLVVVFILFTSFFIHVLLVLING